MRVAPYLFLIASALPLALPLGCGGGTPEPKNADEATASGSKSDEAKPDEAKPDDSAAAAASAAPAPAETSAPAAAPASSAAASGGDLTPPKDDPWSAGHQMAPADVNKTMKAQTGKVQGCFKKAKKKDPSVTGEVKIKFIISNDGKVKDWKDDMSSMSSQDVTNCVGEIVKKLKFPKQKSPGDAVGSYSINFTP
jgi:hypothetical protein